MSAAKWGLTDTGMLRSAKGRACGAPLALVAARARNAHRDPAQALGMRGRAVVGLARSGRAGHQLHLAHYEDVAQRVGAVAGLHTELVTLPLFCYSAGAKRGAGGAAAGSRLLQALQARSQVGLLDMQQHARLQPGPQEPGAPRSLQNLVHLTPATHALCIRPMGGRSFQGPVSDCSKAHGKPDVQTLTTCMLTLECRHKQASSAKHL